MGNVICAIAQRQTETVIRIISARHADASEDAVEYFKAMTEETGIPYQTLINLYLRDCVTQHRNLDLSWKTA